MTVLPTQAGYKGKGGIKTTVAVVAVVVVPSELYKSSADGERKVTEVTMTPWVTVTLS